MLRGVVSVLESEDINLKDPKANVQLVESSVCPGEPAAGGSAEITINRYRIPKADEVEKEAPEKAEAQTTKDGVVVPKGPPPRKPPPKAKEVVEPEQAAVPKMMKPTSKELAVAKAALTPPEGTYGQRGSKSNKITPAKRASPAAVPAAGPPPKQARAEEPSSSAKAAGAPPFKDPFGGHSRSGTIAEKQKFPFHMDKLPNIWEQTEEPNERKRYLINAVGLPGFQVPKRKLQGDEFWFRGSHRSCVATTTPS